MAVLLANNATSRLASSLTAAATTLSVTSGEGAKFPSPTGGDWFPLTLIKSSGALEILRCTARSGDVLTVTRAQEGTAAQAFSAGDRVEVRLTKAVMDAIVQQINDLSNSALLDANNLSDLTNAATARGNLGLGTAATKNAQTSPTDTTAGALMAVGAFGLGSLNVSIASTDLNALSKTGFYRGDRLVNAPLASASWFYVLHQEHGGSGYSSQIAINLTSSTPKTYQRQKVAGTWYPWQELLHTGNISTASVAHAATAGSANTANTALNALGVGQTWQNVTTSRALGTTYTNTTGRPIQILVQYYDSGSRGGATFKIGGLSRKTADIYGDTDYPFWFSAVVPNGVTYSISGAVILPAWWELR